MKKVDLLIGRWSTK